MDQIELMLRHQARAIWDAAVAAVQPARLFRDALPPEVLKELRAAARIIVVGGGKAGAEMAAALEETLAERLDRMEGLVNVPANCVRPLKRIRLYAARPAGVNYPTAEGVAGVERMLTLLQSAGPDDVAVCLLSGGGSALLPAPAEGISLVEKQAVTQMLHQCGATIVEMNAVRKHLSRIKGGGLARAFRGRKLISLIISDVVGDPLDVIASGPTAADPSTFADALAVMQRYGLFDRVPASVRKRLEAGSRGQFEETLKDLPGMVENHILGSNQVALRAAEATGRGLGFHVLNLGAYVEGETQVVAVACVGIVRSILRDGVPISAPACLLVGGETTVTLGSSPGQGGRNQEYVLAVLSKLGADWMPGVVVLSGGTDGEDGPTDAAGAVGGVSTLATASQKSLNPADYLARHDAYPFFSATGDLLQTGPTETNVMDVRLILIDRR